MIRSFAAAGVAALLVQISAPVFISAPAFAQPASATSTRDFITAAAQSDEFERRAGRLAQRMGQNQRVRAFGARLVHDHTESTRKLQAAIRQSGQPVPPPPQLTPDQQQMLDELMRAGRGFDRPFLDQQVRTHEQAQMLMQDYARNGDNPAIRRVAQQTIPMIQNHLHTALHLQRPVSHH